MIRFIRGLVVLVVSLFCFGFFGIEDYLPFVLIVIPIIMLRRVFNKYYIIQFFILFFSVLCYFVVLTLEGIGSPIVNIGKLLYPLIFFLSGYFISVYSTRIYIEKVLLIIGASFSFFAIISYIYTISIYGTYSELLMNDEGRILYSFWNHSPYAATLINAYLSLCIALLPTIFFKKNYLAAKQALILVILFSLSFFVAMVLGNRTAFLIAFIALIMCILGRSGNRFSYVRLMIVLVGFMVLILTNVLDDFLIFQRLTEMDNQNDPRLIAWSQSIEIIKNNPIGHTGLKTNVGYAHNMWLDIGLETGFIPMLGFFSFYLLNTILFIKILLSKTKVFLSYLIICFFSAFTITFMVEPVFQGAFNYFCIYCFFIGLINNFTIRGDK